MSIKKIAIVGAAVVVLGGGGFAAYRFLPWFRPKPPATTGAPASTAKPKPETPEAAAKATPPPSPAPSTAATPGPTAPSSGPATAVPTDGERRLVRLYEGMKPKEAATVMAKLDPELSTTILVGMRERQAAKILGLLPPEKAADLTGRLARARDAAPGKEVTR